MLSLALASQIGVMPSTLMSPCKITSSEWNLSFVTRLNCLGNAASVKWALSLLPPGSFIWLVNSLEV